MKKIISSPLVFLIFFLFIPAATAWADYAYRIDNPKPNGALPYQLSLNVTNSTGTSNSTDLFTGGLCQSTNCSDLVFYTNNQTEVPYWVKTNISDGVRGEIYLNITVNGTLNAYLGKGGVTRNNTLQGERTFIQYKGNATTAYAMPGIKAQPFIYESRSRVTSASHDVRFGVFSVPRVSPFDGLEIESYSTGNARYLMVYNEGSALSSQNEAPSFTANQLYDLSIVVSESRYDAYVNGNEIGTGATTTALNRNMGLEVYIGSGTFAQDYSFIRHYAATPPTLAATWGELFPLAQTPATPTDLSATTGNFWANFTWSPGAGNVSNSYNVSIGGTWYNGTTTTYKNATLSAHANADAIVYAYNNTCAGTLSATPATYDLTISNNEISISNIDASYTLQEGQTFYIDANYTDADSDTGIFADNSSKWNVNTATGIVSWTTVDGDQGTYYNQVNVSDGYGSVAPYNFTVTVTDSTPAAITDLINTTGNFWVNYTWSPGANTDSYNISVNNSWTNASSALYLNTSASAHAWVNISVYAWNSTLNTLSENVSANTQVPNNPTSQAAIGDKNVTAGDWLNFSIIAVDDDSDILTYGTNASNGIFNTTTGYFNWSTAPADVGTYVWYFNSSDGYGGLDSETITVTVSSSYIPPAPMNLTNSTGNYWVNYSWAAGIGNVTDSYNVSVNGAWTNGTTLPWINTTTIASAWVNITVLAFNSSGTGSLNLTAASQNTEAPAAPEPTPTPTPTPVTGGGGGGGWIPSVEDIVKKISETFNNAPFLSVNQTEATTAEITVRNEGNNSQEYIINWNVRDAKNAIMVSGVQSRDDCCKRDL